MVYSWYKGFYMCEPVAVGRFPKLPFRFVKAVHSDSPMEYLRQPSRQHKGQKIQLISDNGKYHKAWMVFDWQDRGDARPADRHL